MSDVSQAGAHHRLIILSERQDKQKLLLNVLVRAGVLLNTCKKPLK